MKAALSLAALLALGVNLNWALAQGPVAPRLFEMRTYTAAEGKLDALNARFRQHTNRLFIKHGMTLIGYWTPAEGPDAKTTLVYILAYPSREAREKAWEGFRADPEWVAARDASEKDGKLLVKVESTFLTPTDYSPLK
jgi:hypothetical protein